jgi:hypothetical protein
MPGKDGEEHATFGAALKTIFWSFFGVRRRAHHESQSVRLKPMHLILTGILAAAIFVIVLASLARFIVGLATG